MPIPAKNWDSMSIDFKVELPNTSQGYRTVMCVVDRRTKFCYLIPMRAHVTATLAAERLHDRVTSVHGLPTEIVTDRDPIFTSNLWQSLMDL